MNLELTEKEFRQQRAIITMQQIKTFWYLLPAAVIGLSAMRMLIVYLNSSSEKVLSWSIVSIISVLLLLIAVISFRGAFGDSGETVVYVDEPNHNDEFTYADGEEDE